MSRPPRWGCATLSKLIRRFAEDYSPHEYCNDLIWINRNIGAGRIVVWGWLVCASTMLAVVGCFATFCCTCLCPLTGRCASDFGRRTRARWERVCTRAGASWCRPHAALCHAPTHAVSCQWASQLSTAARRWSPACISSSTLETPARASIRALGVQDAAGNQAARHTQRRVALATDDVTLHPRVRHVPAAACAVFRAQRHHRPCLEHVHQDLVRAHARCFNCKAASCGRCVTSLLAGLLCAREARLPH